MALLGWALNLGFAGSGVEPPEEPAEPLVTGTLGYAPVLASVFAGRDPAGVFGATDVRGVFGPREPGGVFATKGGV